MQVSTPAATVLFDSPHLQYHPQQHTSFAQQQPMVDTGNPSLHAKHYTYTSANDQLPYFYPSPEGFHDGTNEQVSGGRHNPDPQQPVRLDHGLGQAHYGLLNSGHEQAVHYVASSSFDRDQSDAARRTAAAESWMGARHAMGHAEAATASRGLLFYQDDDEGGGGASML